MLSLKEQCLKLIIENQEPIVRIASHQLINLPSALKNNLTNKSFRKYEYGATNAAIDNNLCVFSAMLLHAELVKVELPARLAKTSTDATKTVSSRLMHSCKKFLGFAEDKSKFQLLLEAIGAKCPRLKLLKINLMHIQCDRLEGTLISVLPRLHALQTLRLSYYCCGDLVLQQISRHCTNLIELEVFLDGSVTPAAFEALSELRHLRYFLFDRGVFEEQEKKFMSLCFEFLPLLRVAGRRLDVFNKRRSYNHNTLAQHNQQPKILSLQDLHVHYGENPAANIQLPELQSMVLREPEGALEMVVRFPTITALGLFQLGNYWDDEDEYEDEDNQLELVLPILQSVGWRLRCLALFDVKHQVLSLLEVLELCPNLERLKVSCCIFNFTTSDDWPEKYFSCMEEVYVGYNECLTTMGLQDWFPQGFIFQLLQNAPLKKVTIHDTPVPMSEIDQLIRMVREKRILNNVVYFRWSRMSKELFRTLQAVFPNARISRSFLKDFGDA